VIRDATLREQLANYAAEKLDQACIKKLLSAARTVQPLHTMLCWIEEEKKERSRFRVLQRLIAAISRASPVTGFVLRPAETAPVLHAIARGDVMPKRSLQTLTILQKNCPCLAEILSSSLCSNGELTFPVSMLPLLGLLGTCCDQLIAGELIDAAVCFAN
jgi:hypothetical protein